MLVCRILKFILCDNGVIVMSTYHHNGMRLLNKIFFDVNRACHCDGDIHAPWILLDAKHQKNKKKQSTNTTNIHIVTYTSTILYTFL